MRRLGRFVVVGVALGLAPLAWSGASVTNPGPVYVGTPFTVEVSTTLVAANATVTFTLANCQSCSVSPVTAPFTGFSNDYTLTITGNYAGNITLHVNLHYAVGTDYNTSVTFELRSPPAQKLVVEAPANALAGSSFNVTITARDNNNNLAFGFNQAVTVTSNDPARMSLGSVTLSQGQGSFSTFLLTPGSRTITAAASGLTNGTDTIGITGPAPHFRIDAPSLATAGNSFGVTVTALDANNMPITGYSATVTLTSTDPQVPSLGIVTLSNGSGTLSGAILRTAGNQTITGIDTNGITGTSGTIAVSAGPATRLSVDIAAPQTFGAGTPFDIRVTAQDAFGNTADDVHTIVLTSSDPQATGMGSKPLTNGTGLFQTYHSTAGMQTITAAPTAGSGIEPGVAIVTITAAAAAHFTVSAPATTTAGTEFPFTVTAKDPFGNLASTYSGTVHFTSSDNQAVLPVDSALAGGMATFQATLKTAGNQKITATDTITSSITGTSDTITVAPGALSGFVFDPPTQNQPAGSPFAVAVRAVDQFSNTVTGYAGPADITSSDGQAVLPNPATVTFTNGVTTFSATLQTAGPQAITVTDQTDRNKTGSTSILVQSTAATHFEFSGVPASVIAGIEFQFTVTARDASGNVAAGYNGMVTFSSLDPLFVPPPNSPLTNGTGTFTALLKTAGSWTITAMDTISTTIRGTSTAIPVVHSTFDHLLISPVPSETVAGVQFSFTVTAKDAFNNNVANYSGPVSISSTDMNADLPAGLTFNNGAGTGQATLKTAGLQTLNATDTAASKSASAMILVNHAPPDRIEIVSGNGQSRPINTVFNPLVVKVVDGFENPISNWQVTFAAPTNGPSAFFPPDASSTATVRTGSDGQASITPSANQTAGSYSVTATASSMPQPLRSTPSAAFSLTNQPGPPFSVKATNTPQSAQVGTQFPDPLIVTVTDSGGNVLGGVDVTLRIPETGPSATLTPPGPYATDASGRVTVMAVANALVGSFNVTASVAGAGSASFVLTNLQAAPGSLTITQGSPQSAAVGSAFGTQLQVQVRDALGTPLNQVQVIFFAVPGTGGASAQLSAESAATNVSGFASVTATANQIAGSHQVRAVAATGGAGTFELTNTPGTVAKIEAVLGAQQSAQVNSRFSEPLRVRVIDQSGNGIPGVTVTFEAPGMGASAALSASSVITDGQGFAQVTATANTVAGSYFVYARTAGVSTPAAFTLENVQQATPTIVASAGTPQSAVVGNPFPQLLQVTVRDGSGAPMQNVTVIFRPPATGASATLSALTARTDAQGQASVGATANTISGVYEIEASAPEVSAGTTALFHLTNLARPAAAIIADAAATPQSTRVNFAFPNPLRVRVTDANGNPVAGATVTWAAPASGPSAQLSSATNITDANGNAVVTAVANGATGSYAVTASTGSLAPAIFNLTNTAGAPATIEIISGNGQTATVGNLFAPLVVAVRDANGNRLPGQTLTFSAPATGATATAASVSVSTDASGQASFSVTANTVAGTYRVGISGAGIFAPAVFELTNRAGAPSQISVAAGGSQLAFAGMPFGSPLQVVVRDAFGNPVGGVTVNFTAPGSGATAILSSATNVTGSSGEASVSAIAGAIAGAYVVTARVAGVAGAASFNLTNVANVPGTITVTGGANQRAITNTAFLQPLSATVRDPRGNPVVGVTVVFTAPASGPSAILSNQSQLTDIQGNVSVAAFANEVAGPFQVVATAAGFSGSAVFGLENRAAAPGEAVIRRAVNGASFVVGASPGSLQTIFGNNLANDTATAGTGPLPLTLSGVSLTIAGTPAPLLFVSRNQINFEVPPQTPTGRQELALSQGGTVVARAPLQLDPAAPGIFLQLGNDPTRAAAQNTNFMLNGPSAPAGAGDYVLMYITGIGPVSPPVPSGQPAPLAPLSLAQLRVTATIGSRPVNVQFAGRAPTTFADQVNLLIPSDLPAGDYPVIIRVNGVPSNPAIISVGAAPR